MYSFPNLEPVHCSRSSPNCRFLTGIQIFQVAPKVVLYSYLMKKFPQFVVIFTLKGFGVINKAEVDVSLEFSCFFDEQIVCWQFDHFFLRLFLVQLEHLEVHSSRTVEVWLWEF